MNRSRSFSTIWVYLLLFTAAVMFAAAPAFCSQGKETISIFGGKSGNVAFKHHLHQNLIQDCQVCHKDFKQEEGALKAAKDAGTLQKKQVMNKTCIACHRAKKKAGEASGPTTCSACHKK